MIKEGEASKSPVRRRARNNTGPTPGRLQSPERSKGGNQRAKRSKLSRCRSLQLCVCPPHSLSALCRLPFVLCPLDFKSLVHLSLSALSGRIRSAKVRAVALQVEQGETQAMEDLGRQIWFVGDLDDPWVAGIAESLPAGTVRIACPGEVTDGLLEMLPSTCTLILHRGFLSRHDAECLGRLRLVVSRDLRLILCLGAHVRHADIVRWGDVADVILPEATARDTLPRHLGRSIEPRAGAPGSGPRHHVAVVSANLTLQETLMEACAVSGYSATPARDWSSAPGACPAVWDVPVLEPEWSLALARRAAEGPVLALLGFADRILVREARAAGAAACLELPFELADFAAALGRITSRRADPAHAIPPKPATWRRRRSARSKSDGERDSRD